MDFIHLLENVPIDSGYLELFNNGNSLPFIELVGIKESLEDEMKQRFDMHGHIPPKILSRYKSILFLVGKIKEYYEQNNLPENYSFYEKF